MSQRLRTLIRSDDRGVVREMDIATVGLMERVRDEWQSRQDTRDAVRFDLPQLLRSLHRTPTAAGDRGAGDATTDDALGRGPKARSLDADFFTRRRYTVAQLAGFSDAGFIDVAYRCLLKRAPDPAGSSAFLRLLRDGSRDRVDVLRALHASSEGQAQRVEIVGLARAAWWRRAERLRYLGPVVGWLIAVASAGRLARRLRILEARSDAADHHVEARLHALVHTDLARLAEAIAHVEKSQVQVETAMHGFGNRFRRFLLEAEMREATRGAGAGAGDSGRPSAPRVDDLESAVHDNRARLDALAATIGAASPSDPHR